MACFSLAWLEALIVYIIIIGAVIAILRLVIPWAMTQIGIPLVAQILNIVLYAIIAILVIYIVFALLACLLGGASFLPPFPHR